MTVSTLPRVLAMVALSALALTGCATPASDAPAAEPAVCDGVSVVVNFGLLGAEAADTCVPIEGDSAAAADVVAEAGLEVEGTAAYGNQIVCRVNGLPSADEPFTVEGQEPFTETCAEMPPAFAYWALWVKADSGATWEYATEGLGTLSVKKGESLGLIFTTGDETPTPN